MRLSRTKRNQTGLCVAPDHQTHVVRGNPFAMTRVVCSFRSERTVIQWTRLPFLRSGKTSRMRRISSMFPTFFSPRQYSSLDFHASVPCLQARISVHDSRARQWTEGLGQRPAMGSCGRNTRTRTSFSVKQPHPQNPGSTRVLGRPSRFEVEGLSSSMSTASAGNLILTCWMRARVTTTSPKQVSWFIFRVTSLTSPDLVVTNSTDQQLGFLQYHANPLLHQQSSSQICPFWKPGLFSSCRQKRVQTALSLHGRAGVGMTTWAWRPRRRRM